jgi:hypothetical protein
MAEAGAADTALTAATPATAKIDLTKFNVDFMVDTFIFKFARISFFSFTSSI